MGLVQRAIEARGIPTVALSVRRGQSAGTRPPRVLVTPFTRGETVGPPHDAATQRAVLRQALALLTAPTPGIMEDYVPHSVT